MPPVRGAISAGNAVYAAPGPTASRTPVRQNAVGARPLAYTARLEECRLVGTPVALPGDVVEKLLRLSALSLATGEKVLLQGDLDKIVGFINAMQSVDTRGVLPLAHPLDGTQPLRADDVTESIDRDRLQRNAPLTRDGLYLVPRVVE